MVTCDCAATPPTMPKYREHHLPTCPVSRMLAPSDPTVPPTPGEFAAAQEAEVALLAVNESDTALRAFHRGYELAMRHVRILAADQSPESNPEGQR